MESKEFVYQRICIFAGEDIDPNSDEQVEVILRRKFHVQLPQRRSLNESLAASKFDHEIVSLILKYRAMN